MYPHNVKGLKINITKNYYKTIIGQTSNTNVVPNSNEFQNPENHQPSGSNSNVKVSGKAGNLGSKNNVTSSQFKSKSDLNNPIGIPGECLPEMPDKSVSSSDDMVIRDSSEEISVEKIEKVSSNNKKSR